MSSPFDRIPQLAAWLAASSIDRLELVGPEGRILLRRDAGGTRSASVDRDERVSSIGPEEPAAPAVVGVTSPGIGQLLRTHPLHEQPLIEEGATVVAGQPLALLRVGALLMPVPAPIAGTVVAVRREAGALVGYGDTLFDLRPQP